MFSALERFETLAVSALLDIHLAMKMNTYILKDKQQSHLLFFCWFFFITSCTLRTDVGDNMNHRRCGKAISCSATLLGFSEF